MQRRPAAAKGKTSTGGRPAKAVDLNFAALDKVLANQRAKQERQQQQQVQQRNKDVQQGPKHAAADAPSQKAPKRISKPPPAAVSLPDLTPEEADDLFDQVAQQVVTRWKGDDSDDEESTSTTSIVNSKPSTKGGFKAGCSAPFFVLAVPMPVICSISSWTFTPCRCAVSMCLNFCVH
jgi:hypothetical protein